eukprot:TRINITY_DN9347_c0_g1_i1.p1 TRINITY_DN9347_c0_g1~~TRINITY_DN9347_c0_g1_i1.p1  ORF type:complete len:406 (-),score=90.70 TRINITY_DN9347_c0_g1_i1:186-1403(-)
MDELPGLPVEVPQEYREQLIKFQNQIKILVNNHQILVSRSRKNPQDHQVLKQIDDVKNYLISFSDQQRDVLDRVRSYLKGLEDKRKKPLSPPDSPELVPALTSSKQELKTSRCSTPVKNSKSKSKKKAKGKSSKNSSSISPDSSDDECDEIFLAYFDSTEGYCGHIENYDINCPPVDEEKELVDENTGEELLFSRTQETLDSIQKENYMLNIDLLTDSQYNMSVSHLELIKKRKSLKRVSTYIPEVADKKYRYQTFLQNSITSPPHLRQRKPNQLPTVPRPVKSLSFPTTEKMETRNKSPSLSKSQVDGANDLSDSDSGENEENDVLSSDRMGERIELRNSLLKRKREMEMEIVLLQKKAKVLQEVREMQKEERCLLLKKQNETDAKIRNLHLFVAELCHPPEIL